MKKGLFFKLTLLFVFALFLQNGFAQDYTRWGLPDGAKARLNKGKPHDIVYSPDGTRLAVTSHIGIWLYDAHTGTELALLTGHTEGVLSSAYSPDGSTLASGSGDSTIRLWDATTGEHKQTLYGHTQAVLSVAFSPDGGTLASGSDDNTIRLWDVTTGQHKYTLEGHTGWVRTIAYSPVGDTLASGSHDDTLRLWDTTTGKHKQTLEGHTDAVYSIAYSPDGRTLASGSWDKTIRLWDAITGEHKHTLEEHTRWIRVVTYSPDGSTLASGSGDRTILLWDTPRANTSKPLKGIRMMSIRSRTRRTEAHSSAGVIEKFICGMSPPPDASKPLRDMRIMPIRFLYSPDGGTLASRGYDEIWLWDATTGGHKRTLRHEIGIASIAYSPDGDTPSKRELYSWELRRFYSVMGYHHWPTQAEHFSA